MEALWNREQLHTFILAMSSENRHIPWFSRIVLSVLVGLIVFAIIWVSSQFRNPPGMSWLMILLLVMAYVTFEVTSKLQHYLSDKLLLKNERMAVLASMLLAIAAGTLAYSLMFYGFKWIDHWVAHSEPPYTQHMVMAALIGLIMSVIFAFIQLGFNWKSRFYNSQLENERFKREIAQANLALLKNQLDPHFMFNNFNTLYYLIEEDTDLARKFLKNVSTIYRYILQNNDRALIPAREEYAMARQYLEVIQQRYADLLTLEDQIAPGALDQKDVPPLVLQQLIENAIKHNRVDEASPLCLTFSEADGYLTVSNNRNPKRQVASGKTGLKNIARRYEYLTPRKVSIHEDQAEFSVSVPLIAADA